MESPLVCMLPNSTTRFRPGNWNRSPGLSKTNSTTAITTGPQSAISLSLSRSPLSLDLSPTFNSWLSLYTNMAHLLDMVWLGFNPLRYVRGCDSQTMRWDDTKAKNKLVSHNSSLSLLSPFFISFPFPFQINSCFLRVQAKCFYGMFFFFFYSFFEHSFYGMFKSYIYMFWQYNFFIVSFINKLYYLEKEKIKNVISEVIKYVAESCDSCCSPSSRWLYSLKIC